MTSEHPPRDSPQWDNPDLCPFCGVGLSDGGSGFIDHIAKTPMCNERFQDWRAKIRDDIGGEWGG